MAFGRLGTLVSSSAICSVSMIFVTFADFQGVVDNLEQWSSSRDNEPDISVCICPSNIARRLKRNLNDTEFDSALAMTARHIYNGYLSRYNSKIAQEIVIENSSFWLDERIELTAKPS